MTSMIELDRAELVDFLEVKRSKALRKQNMRKVYELSLWINFVKRQATSVQVEEFYCEYWNNHIAPALAASPVQLSLF